jgi:hypothetical protein
MNEDEILALANSLGGQEPQENKDITQEDIDRLAAQFGATMPMTQMFQQAAENLPSSALQVGKDIYQAVRHPIQTASTLYDLGVGAFQVINPNTTEFFLKGGDPKKQQLAKDFGKYIVNRYGSIESAKRTFAEDPAGFSADLSTLFTGVAGVSKATSQAASAGLKVAPGVRTGNIAYNIKQASEIAANIASMSAKYTEPLTLPLSIGGKTIQWTAGTVVPGVFAMTTGAGMAPILKAFESGRKGGQELQQFTEAMRGSLDILKPLEIAKQNLDNLRQARSAQYVASMAEIKADPAILSFNDIDSALQKGADRVFYEGKVKDTKGAEVLQQLQTEINNWRNLDPATYHTPMGMDALKQKLYDDILAKISYDDRNARAVAGGVIDSLRSTINTQAPTYAKIMSDYSEMSDLIRQIEQSFSMTSGGRFNADTALRKLQSIMRNNVNTNYGQRESLATQLEKAGEPFTPALAGQSLSSPIPRGLQTATSPLAALAGYSYNPILGAATAAASSPRLVGEASRAAGIGTRGLLDNRISQGVIRAGSYATNPAVMNMLYQSQQIPQ